MKLEELTFRWKASDVERVGNLLVKGGRIACSTFPEFALIDGRLDLRGIELPVRGYTPGITIGTSFASPPPLQTTVKSTRFDSVDISFGNLTKRIIENSEFANVHFIKTSLEAISVHSSRFIRCIFDRTNLNNAGMGYSGTRYENCLFKKVNFSRTSFGCPEFDDCRFEDCNFDNVDFFGSSFERCTFIGKVHNAWFYGHYPSVPGKPEFYDNFVKQYGIARPNKMKDVDFRGADLRDLTFSDECDLSTCKIPKDEFVVGFSQWLRVLKAVEARIPYMFEAGDGDVLQIVKVFDAHAHTQEWYIINFRDLLSDLSLSVIERLKELFIEEAKKIGAIYHRGD